LNIELITIIGTILGIIAIIVKFVIWLRSRISSKKHKATNDHEIWDVEIFKSLPDNSKTIVARLAVKAKSLEEARDRAGYLVTQWGEIRLGFAFPPGQEIPTDDEGKPIGIVRPDLLPEVDDQTVDLTVTGAKRVRN